MSETFEKSQLSEFFYVSSGCKTLVVSSYETECFKTNAEDILVDQQNWLRIFFMQ